MREWKTVYTTPNTPEACRVRILKRCLMLLGEVPLTVEQGAALTGVSTRTIWRDFIAMEAAGLPVKTSGSYKKNGRIDHKRKRNGR